MNKRRRWKAKARRLDAKYLQRWHSMNGQTPRGTFCFTINMRRDFEFSELFNPSTWGNASR